MRERSLELRVGLFVLAALILLTGLIIALGNYSLGRGFHLFVDFEFVGHLNSGAPVKLAGINAGRIEEVRYMGGTTDPTTGRRVYVRVKAWIEERFHPTITRDTEFFINTQGVLGQQYLEVVPGEESSGHVSAGDVLVGVSPPRTDLILARLYSFLDSITRLLSQDRDAISNLIRAGASAIGTVDQVLTSNEKEIHQILGHLAQLSNESTQLVRNLRTGVGDPRRLSRMLNRLDQTTAAINRNINPLLAKTNRVLDGAVGIAEAMGPPEQQKIAKALDRLLALADKALAAADNADQVLSTLSAGKGTAGALLMKEELYDDVREMVRDLKQNPWKFLWRD